jgi:hypothetical protein
MVADVVAEVLQRRCEERRYPDGIDAKRRDMIQPLKYSIQIAVAIGVTVGKAERIYELWRKLGDDEVRKAAYRGG